MNDIAAVVSFLVIGLFLVTFVTDLMTQVIKKVTYDKIPTNIVCLIIAVILAVIGCFIGAAIGVYVLAWYHFVIAVILGFFAAFIGMNGYYKLVQIFKQYEGILDLAKERTAKASAEAEVSGETTEVPEDTDKSE